MKLTVSPWAGETKDCRQFTRRAGGTREGSRFEVLGFRNFEPGTSNFVSRFSRSPRFARQGLWPWVAVEEGKRL
jgi:hypothetical protein